MKKKVIYGLVGISLIRIFLSTPAHAAIAFVSTSTAGGVAAATTATTSINTISGNLLSVECRHGTTFVNPTSVTDTIGNTYTNAVIASNTVAGAISGYWAISSGSNAANIVSCNFASSVSNRVIAVQQHSGIAQTNPLDVTSTAATASSVTSLTSGAYTTTNANEVIITYVDANSDGSVTSVSAPFTATFLTAAAFGNGGAYNIVSTIQTAQTVTWNFSISSAFMIVMTFKAATQPILNPLIINYTTGAKNSVIVNYTTAAPNSLIVQ